jgi:hypothetical protein
MLKNQIGHDAGKIWGILDSKGELSLKVLQTTSGLSEKSIFMALGWLAREHKVYIHEKKKELLVCLI